MTCADDKAQSSVVSKSASSRGIHQAGSLATRETWLTPHCPFDKQSLAGAVQEYRKVSPMPGVEARLAVIGQGLVRARELPS